MIFSISLSSLRDNLSAEHRGKAAQLAYDMADRIRSNVDRANLVGLNDYDGAVAVENANCIIVPVVGCTAQEQAGHDIFEWKREVGKSLPLGDGNITASAGMFSIIVEWDDNRNGAIDASDAAFTIRFEP